MSLALIERYRDRLPLDPNVQPISLGEGSTPLVPLKGPPEAHKQGIQLYAKLEGLNPTGSFKDRGMTVAVSQAVAGGAQAIGAASTGNTSASAAAYAARAGITALVVVPAGKIALGKLAQTLIHGARVVQIEANFDRALELVQQIGELYPVALVNSINPYRIEGQKTLAFEVAEELGRMPDFHALPVGNAGNITAHWRGYCELTGPRPKMLGFQAAGAAPIVLGHPVANPETIASAIRIGNPASWQGALAARDQSGGVIEAVSDDEILSAYRYLASVEGIFCEPASAAALAGVWRLVREERLAPGSTGVLTLTGNGLKDPTTAEAQVQTQPPVAPELEAVVRAAGL